MSDREFSSEQEYFDGVRKDGRRPVLQSRQMYPGSYKPWTREPSDFPFENRDPRTISADEMRYMVKLQELDDIELVQRTAREMIALGTAAARGNSPAGNGRGSGSSTSTPEEAAPPAGTAPPGGTVPEVRDCPRSSNEPAATATLDPSKEEQPESPGIPGTGTVPKVGDSSLSTDPDLRFRLRLVNPKSGVQIPDPTIPPEQPETPPLDKPGEILNRIMRTETEQRGRRDTERRGQSPTSGTVPTLKPEAGLVLAERGCKLLMSVSPKRTALALELIEMAMELETKRSFMWDRAHAVVYCTLLHLDEHWKELGFGSWMPFRWPDQWLSFCGIMSRVLAANGLIHAKHADTYRKLLDETPPVAVEGTAQDRVKESRTPHNIARCKSNQGAYTMSELKKRLKTEKWDPADELERKWNEHDAQMNKPPP